MIVLNFDLTDLMIALILMELSFIKSLIVLNHVFQKFISESY